MSLKIVEFSDAYFPSVDGVVNVVSNYMTVLNKKNICKLVVPAYPKKRGYVDNQSFDIFRCKSMFGLEGYRLALPQFDKKLLKFLKEEKFDIIHVHSPFGLGKYAVNIGKKLNIPVVATMHTKYYDDILRIVKLKAIAKLELKSLMKVYKKADSVWTVSQGACNSLREYGYKGKIQVVQNGTDFCYPQNAEELITKVNKKHNLFDKKNVFLFVGRLALYKNIEFILQSLKVLKEKNVDFVMLFVGSGFDEEKIKEMTIEYGLKKEVIFTGMIKNRKDLQEYYLRADLFLFPSLFDTNGLVSIEAAAHKLPTLMIKDTCAAENIQDNVNGFLAENNIDSYSKKLLEIIKDSKKLEQAGDNAYKTIYKNWEAVGEEVLQNYKKVIEDFKKKNEK